MTAQPACAVCGTPCKRPFRAPAAELAPDLDGRPGEPARSTLPRWVALCRTCGAAAPDLAALPAAAASVVERDDYRAEANPFLRWAALCAASGDGQAEAEAVLQAAWTEEDAGGDATALRLRAAGLWRAGDLRRVDVLRRAGAFDAALQAADAAAGAAPGADEEAARIIAFQRARIAAADAGRHTIASALRPPARTPHVAHRQQARQQTATGLLGRLFGRRP